MNITTSEARREANRRNAQKSTGPKTDAGKASSRRNALKHGLTSTVVDLDGDDRGQVGLRSDRESDGGEGSEARSGWHYWVAGQVARATRQIDRAQRVEARLRDQAIWRALAVWEDDRKLEAEELGAGLSRDPARTVAKLRLTPQGCDWLIRRWGWLARAAEGGPESWTEAQVRLAFDLLGTAEAGRFGPVSASTDDFDPSRPTRTPLELARGMIDELRAHRVEVAEADQIARALAEADLSDTPTPELARLRRYEQALHRRLGWLLAELRGEPHATPRPASRPDTAQSPARPAPSSPLARPIRNEANAPITLGETKPTSGSFEPILSPEPPLPPTRNRPDLAKLARREQRRRRDRRRHRVEDQRSGTNLASL